MNDLFQGHRGIFASLYVLHSNYQNASEKKCLFKVGKKEVSGDLENFIGCTFPLTAEPVRPIIFQDYDNQ